jgi:tyrosyl-tRNA synthetase
MVNDFQFLQNLGAEVSSKNACSKTAFWGVAPTGDIHIGYLPYVGVLKHLKKIGYKIIIFIGDYHGYLDSEKTEYSKIDERSQRYLSFFTRLGFSQDDILFAKKEYKEPQYIDELFKFSKYVELNKSLHFAERTLKSYETKETSLADGLYVLTQILDLEYFNVNLVLSGIDEAGIYRLGIPIIEKRYNRKVDYCYFPMMRGVYAEEMHSSNNEDNKILIFENKESMIPKLKQNRLLIEQINNYIFPIFQIPSNEDLNYTVDNLIKIWNE